MAVRTRERKLTPYFKPAEHANDVILIVEPLSIARDVQSNNGPRDEVTAKLTAFKTTPALERGEPTFEGEVLITPKVLTRNLDEIMREAKEAGDTAPAYITRLGKWSPPGGGNPSWIWKDQALDDSDYVLAVKYYEKREAALDDIEF